MKFVSAPTPLDPIRDSLAGLGPVGLYFAMVAGLMAVCYIIVTRS